MAEDPNADRPPRPHGTPNDRRVDVRLVLRVLGCGALVLGPIVGFVILWCSAPPAPRTHPVSAVRGFGFGSSLLSMSTDGVRSIHEARLSSGLFESESLYRIDCEPCVFTDYVFREGMSVRRDERLRERFRALVSERFPDAAPPETVFARSDFEPDGPTPYGDHAACGFDEAASRLFVWLKVDAD